MKRIKDPILFSQHFGIDGHKLTQSGLIDPFLNVDTPLFIDPILLEKSSNPHINTHAIAAFRKHFGNFVRLLDISEKENDVAWIAAQRLLDLSEPPENGLGYGGSGRSGSSRPDTIRDAMIRTSKEIIRLGSKDPEMISLMGFFEEDVGPDTISDFTTSVIMNQLAAVTEEFCDSNNIPVQRVDESSLHRLPIFNHRSGRNSPIVLVPSDIVRELPIAKDWSDIEKAALENAQIRQRVNAFLAGIARPTISERKSALRRAALGSSHSFNLFISAVKENVESYDPNLDALGYYRIKSIIANGFVGLKQERNYNLESGPDELMIVVLETIEFFKHHVEKGNLWEELWINGKPKKERASQLIYYAIADGFCSANNIDVSPEANMGGGPIDFKFSKGYNARVLVEMKRSSGTVVHGYTKQLEIYKDASRTQYGVFIIMDYGDLGGKLAEIQKLRELRIQNGEPASEIIVIDATPKASASKRK